MQKPQESKPDNHSDQTNVALKHLELCRQETIERLRIREQIIGGYTVAVVALFGYVASSGGLESLLILLPLLAFAGAFSVAMHQEQIHAFALYIRSDLVKFLPADSDEVPAFEHSSIRANSTRRLIFTVLFSQLILFLSPWVLFAYFYYKNASNKNPLLAKIELIVGAVLMMLVSVRLIMAFMFRMRCDRDIKRLNEAKDSARPSAHNRR